MMRNLLSNAIAHRKKTTSEPKDATVVRLSTLPIEFIEHHVQVEPSRAAENQAKSEDIPDHLDLGGQSLLLDDESTLPPETEDAAHCQLFLQALEQFEATLPTDHQTRINFQSRHDWAEVMAEAKVAEMVYTKKGGKESPFGRVRGFFRSLQKQAPLLDGCLTLLPSQSIYGSLICGGFKLILRAATRMSEIREFMLETLAAIPDELERAQLMIDYNKGLDTSGRLRQRVSGLYVKVFGILDSIINWYSERSITRQFKVLVQQSNYESELKGKVCAFRKSVEEVQREAELCNMCRQSAMGDRYDTMIELLQCLFQSNPKLSNDWRSPSVEIAIGKISSRRKTPISRQTLRDSVLRFDENTSFSDMSSTLNRMSELTTAQQDQVVYVMETPIFKDWLTRRRNGQLLIRGSSIETHTGGSGMSFLAAHFIQSSLKARSSGLLSLYWFTGYHRNSRRDADGNVQGIVRSLTGQLLRQCRGFDLYFIKQSTVKAMQSDDLEVLCNVFDELIF